MKEIEEDSESLKGLPSFVTSWKQVYWFVIIEMTVVIGLFYWFTKTFE